LPPEWIDWGALRDHKTANRSEFTQAILAAAEPRQALHFDLSGERPQPRATAKRAPD